MIILPQTPFNAQLQKIVRFYYTMTIEKGGSENDWLTLFPNCSTNLTIKLDGPLATSGGVRSDPFLSTSCIRPLGFSRNRSVKIIGVQFEPFGLYSIIGIPMSLMTNDRSLF